MKTMKFKRQLPMRYQTRTSKIQRERIFYIGRKVFYPVSARKKLKINIQ